MPFLIRYGKGTCCMCRLIFELLTGHFILFFYFLFLTGILMSIGQNLILALAQSGQFLCFEGSRIYFYQMKTKQNAGLKYLFHYYRYQVYIFTINNNKTNIIVN